LKFDDLIGLGVTIAVQRMRRLRLQHGAWLVAQNPEEFESIKDPLNPFRAAGIHTEVLSKSM
jgi:hypothetical protein